LEPDFVRIVAVTLSAALAAPGAEVAPGRPDGPDCAALARDYRATRGLEALPADASAVSAALERNFAAIDVGLFEARYPWSSLADAKRVDELKQIVLGLIDLQASWLTWIDDSSPPSPPPPELAVVRQWAGAWKPEAVRKAVGQASEPRTLLAVTGADEPVTAALRAFAARMRTGTAHGFGLDGDATRLVLAATRSEFVGFTAFVGSLSEEWRRLLWQPSLPLRVEFHLNDLLCLALEHPAADGSDPGLSMNLREASGQRQHVLQYAADRLTRRWCGAALDSGLQIGAAVDLVIGLLGENNSRVFGSGEGNQTPEKKKFVRGGRSHGGKFAKTNADSRWRARLGRGYFTDVLHDAQAAGAKLAAEERQAVPGRTSAFVLDCKDEPGAHELAVAPFLGGAAASKGIPANFFADYQEFLRAYRSCFVHWLRTQAKGAGGEPPPSTFARLLRTCATAADRPIEERIAALYATPLTAPDPSGDSLEWRFLAWLARQR